MKPGAKNSITDIAGLKVGNADDPLVNTGVTVILPESAARCAVDVRGGGPGTRETDALDDSNLIEEVHAIVLSGGSVYGLAAADGVCTWLGSQRIGFEVAPAPVPVSPIVPSAILFDNANGGDKDWGMSPPYHDLGITACEAASHKLSLGKVGAGYGATAGLYVGGLGTASEIIGDITVGALIAANPVGSPYMPETDCFWAWPYEINDEFGGRKPQTDFSYSQARDTKFEFLRSRGASTVIGVVATDARLSRRELRRVAIMAQDGIAMAVQPAHTSLDGDSIFALSVGDEACDNAVDLAMVGAAAARCVARAIARGVYEASK